MIGKDESALREPWYYTYKKSALSRAVSLYVEKPLMENYYPGASVGYRKVTVRSLGSQTGPQCAKAPLSIYAFYTPKDFPVFESETDMTNNKPIVRPMIVPGFFTRFIKRTLRSQGFMVELNDMAGKLRSVELATIDNTTGKAAKIISKQEYEYFTDPNNSQKLLNTLSLVTSDGQLKQGVMGREHDIFVDMHEDKETNTGAGASITYDGTASGIPFFIMPIIYKNKFENKLRTIVTHKIKYSSGILKSVTVSDEQSRITTENLAFDAETGNALLTKVTNEYKDPVYNYSFPAHWYYAQMGGAYKNYGANFSSVTAASDGKITVSNASDYFVQGDEVYLTSSTLDKRAHVIEVGSNYIKCIYASGADANEGKLVKNISAAFALNIIRSGRKNLQTAMVGGLVAKDYTVNGSNQFSFGKIINASAVEYSDDWQGSCGQAASTNPTFTVCNLGDGAKKIKDFFNNAYIKQNLLNCISSSRLAENNNDVNTCSYVITGNTTAGQQYAAPWCTLMGRESCTTFSTSGVIESATTDNYHNTFMIAYNLCFSQNDCCSFELIFDSGETPSLIQHNFSLADVVRYDNVRIDPTYNNGQGFIITAYFRNGTTIDLHGWFSCVSPGTCETVGGAQIAACGKMSGDALDPFTRSLRGNWRPVKSYAYTTGRNYSAKNSKEDGYFSDFTKFNWTTPSSNNADKWVTASTATKYSPDGYQLESKDAIGNYSAQLYGYNNNVAIAAGGNTRYRELANDNFEFYGTDCGGGHFDYSAYAPLVTTEAAHSGFKSLKLYTAQSVTVERKVGGSDCAGGSTQTPVQLSGEGDQFTLADCGCVGKFSPLNSKKYVVSAWVKASLPGSQINPVTDYSNAKVVVAFKDVNNAAISGTAVTATGSGPIIEGWQRVYALVDVPGNATTITVTLQNEASNGNIGVAAYFDDVRIHPFNSNIKTFVYDPLTYKLLAELDANNFATFYIYDEGHNLIKVNVETEKGIQTVKEENIEIKRK